MGIPLRVLLVEDAEDDAVLILRQLKKGGYKTTAERVDTPEAMSKALTDKKWDIVLADFRMPHFSAPAALELLNSLHPEIPLIIVSGAIGEEAAVEAMRNGAKDFIMKGNWARLIPAVEREFREALLRQEQRLIEQALHKSEVRYRTVVETANVGIVTIDQDGKIRVANRSFENILGYTYQEVLDQAVTILFPDSSQVLEKVLEKAKENKKNSIHFEPIELSGRHKKGHELWLELFIGEYVEDNQYMFTIIIHNITERKFAEKQLKEYTSKLEQYTVELEENNQELIEAHEQLRLAANVYENTAEGIMVTNVDGIIQSINPAFTMITGYNAEDVTGKNPKILKSHKHKNDFYDNMWKAVSQGYWEGEIWNRRKNGEIYPQWMVISSIKNDHNEIVQYLAVFSDISEIKRSEERLQYMAYHDSLTGLSNRHHFQLQLEERLAEAEKHNQPMALMFIDLDRFKVINDTLGHSIGDLVLREVADRLRNCIDKDNHFLSRWGGDEFTLTLINITNDEITSLAKMLLKALTVVYSIDEYEFFLSASIGIACYPNDGAITENLIKNADKAMFQAKEMGKNNFQFYSKVIDNISLERLTFEKDLHLALEKNEFKLLYQPQFQIETGKIIGVEALVYWQRDNKTVSPGEFIPICEETGLIIPLGKWVLRTACKQNKFWQNKGLHPIPMAVNLSAIQFMDKVLMKTIDQILCETEMSPNYLDLELTEGILMQNIETTTILLLDLKARGIQISIDDFGTGYSSLSYLSRFPIDKLKIDRSFVQDLNLSPDDAAIVKAIIAMGHSMNIKVVAEGVESQNQLDFLQEQQCDEVQGYLMSRPVPADQITALLVNNQS